MRRLRFRNKKNRKPLKDYVDPNALKEDQDDPKAYLKELAGLATILGAGATGATILPDDRVYAAQTSVDPKSQIVGSVADSTQTGTSTKPDSKSNEKGFSISNSEAKSMSASSSKSLLISQSTSASMSLSESLSQSESLSHSLSQSESLLSSLSLAQSKEKHAKSETKKSTNSHKSTSKEQKSELNKDNKHSEQTSKNSEKSTAANVASNNFRSDESTVVSNYGSASNGVVTKAEASLNLSNDISSLSNLPLAFNNLTTATTNHDNSTSNNSNSQLPVALAANFMTLAATDDAVVKPNFSGTVWLDANGKSYSGTNVPNYTFRLSTYDSTTNPSTVKNPQFIVAIPAGFAATPSDFTFNDSTYPGKVSSVTYLGEVEDSTNKANVQLFEISLTGNTPYYNKPVIGQVKLSINSQASGQYTYSDWNLPLISELSEYGNEGAPGGAGGGSYTFTVNDKTYNVVKSQYTINEKSWYDAGSTVTYSVNQSVKPTFTGATSLGNILNGIFVSANDTNYTADTPTPDLPTLNVRLSTSGVSTIDNPQFIVTIPKGFKVSGNSLISSDTVSKYFDGNFKGTNSFNSSDYSVESLGTNSNGEEVYSVKLNFNPSESDNKDLGLQFKLAVDPSAKGNFKYDSTTPLVTELASDGQSTAGTSTVTVNGTTYDVVKSSNAINVSYYINDAQLPSFTGDVAFGNLNSSNQFVSGSSINYTSTSTNLPTLSVRLSTNGTSTVKNPQFIVMIPKGFTSSTSDFGLIPANSGNYFNGVFNGSNKSKDYSIQDLGKIGPNGEQLFKITLNFNPSWSSASNFGGQFKLTLDPTQKGYYTYDSKTAPIVSELASDATSSVSGDNKTYTFDANGQNIKVVNSSYASSNSINYGIDTNELPTFTGTANLLDANGNPIADNTVYSGTQVPQYTFRLSTAGNSTVQNPKFIVMIPAGFTATTDSFKFTYGSYDGHYLVLHQTLRLLKLRAL